MELQDRLVSLSEKFDEKKGEMSDIESLLNFKRKCQYCNDWIEDRLRRLNSENINVNDMAMITGEALF